MPTYMESEIPTIVSTGNGNNGNGMFGNDGWWGIILIALLFGWGRGNGFGGYGGSGSEFLGYELGKTATVNDIASGFNNSAVLNSLNEIKLGQANAINYNNQGFSGLNTQLLTGFHGVDNALCTLGYNINTGLNGISREIADCCCKTNATLLENRYLNEKQTCDILRGQQDQTREILNYLTTEKIDTLNRKLATAEAAYAQCQNNAYLLGQIKPQPVPAYPVFPATSFAYPTGVSFGVGTNCNNYC